MDLMRYDSRELSSAALLLFVRQFSQYAELSRTLHGILFVFVVSL